MRTDELRAGFSALAATYRSRLDGSPRAQVAKASLLALELVDEASVRLTRNANETLLLQWLLLRLDSLV